MTKEEVQERDRIAAAFGMGSAALCWMAAGLEEDDFVQFARVAWKWAKKVQREKRRKRWTPAPAKSTKPRARRR